VSRTFAGAIVFSASLFGVRFRVEGVSARTGAILIREISCGKTLGQPSASYNRPFCRGLEKAREGEKNR
jgi:hypothetical protein